MRKLGSIKQKDITFSNPGKVTSLMREDTTTSSIQHLKLTDWQPVRKVLTFNGVASNQVKCRVMML